MAETPDFFDVQIGSAGRAVGPKLRASLFIPSGMGLVWQDTNGTWWQETFVIDESGQGTTQLFPITL